MKHAEAVQLTRLVHAICPQQAIDQYTPDAWSELLGDLRTQDCMAAVRNLGKRQVFIAPAEIRTEVRRIRNERLAATPDPIPPHDLTPVQTIEWLRNTRKAIADGTYTEADAGELKPRDMRQIEQTLREVEA
jgi:hypothetical protein